MAVAAQFLKLLDSCQEMEFSHLRPLVDRMFENADVALLDFAEKAESNSAQSLFFEAMSAVRHNRRLIEERFYAQLKRGFNEFPLRPNSGQQAAEQAQGPDSLSLIETDELETFVATQNAAGKLASRIMDRIFALKQRLAVINNGNTIEEAQIPGGPGWLAAAFQHSVEELELEHKVRMVLIALFDKYVLSRADNLFDEYNKRLIQADILPNLRYEIRRQAGSVEIIEKQVQPESADPSSVAGQDDEPEADQSPSELGDELFGRICELMSGRRGRTGAPGRSASISPIHGPAGNSGGGGAASGGGGSGSSGGGSGSSGGGSGSSGGGSGSSGGGSGGSRVGDQDAGGTTLLGQINRLQSSVHTTAVNMSSDEFIENIEVDEQLIERLQDALAGEREKIFKGVDRRKLSGADTDVIELVGLMFEYMLKEETLPNIVKALLSRLHTPLLKVGVIDRSFFTHQGHPARRLLNDMTAAGIRWVDEAHIDRGVFPKMKELVDKLLLDFKEDVGIFDTLLEAFTGYVNELEQRASRVEERTTEAADGQEKLQAARSRAQQEIGNLSRNKPLPQAAHDFLQRILADKLTFILLRNAEGDQSADWQPATALIERIVASVLPPADDLQREDRLKQLDTLQEEIRAATGTLHQGDKEKLMHGLFALQSVVLTETKPENIPLAAPVAEEPAGESVAGNTALSPAQEAMLEKLKNVPFGTWFEFEKPGETKRRAKLSWRSTVTEKFMFVDQMGVKAAVVCMHELADCMLDGSVRIASTEKKPFVDRALNAIHRMLDHAA